MGTSTEGPKPGSGPSEQKQSPECSSSEAGGGIQAVAGGTQHAGPGTCCPFLHISCGCSSCRDTNTAEQPYHRRYRST